MGLLCGCKLRLCGSSLSCLYYLKVWIFYDDIRVWMLWEGLPQWAVAHWSGPKTDEWGLVCNATKTAWGPVVKQEFRFYFGLNCWRRKTRLTLAQTSKCFFSWGTASSRKARRTLLHSQWNRSLLKVAHFYIKCVRRAKIKHSLWAARETLKVTRKWIINHPLMYPIRFQLVVLSSVVIKNPCRWILWGEKDERAKVIKASVSMIRLYCA